MACKFLYFFRKLFLIIKVENSKLRTKFIFYFLTLTILSLFGAAFFSYFYVSFIIREKTNQYVSQIFLQANENIDYYLKGMVNIFAVLNADEGFKRAVRKTNYFTNQYDKIKNEYAISNILRNVVGSRREIYASILFAENNLYASSGLFANTVNIEETDWFRSIALKHTDMLFVANHLLSNIDFSIYVYSLVGNVYDVISGDRLGILLISIDDKVINRTLDKIRFFVESSIIMLDQHDRIVYRNINSPDLEAYDDSLPDLLGKKDDHIKIIGENKYFVISQKSDYSQFRIIGIIPYNIFIQDARTIKNRIILIALAFCAGVFIISLALSFRITKPLISFINKMKKVGKGEFTVKADYKSFYEINQLSQEFNRMIRKISKLIKKLSEEKTSKRKTEIKALQMEINPHFLYNTLDSIKWIAILQNADQVAKIIKLLVRLLQISTSGGHELISVKDEIEHVKSYLEIQKLRYIDKFDVLFDIREEALKCKTAKIILQPIVENSIFHGLEPKKLKGNIKVSCFVQENKLIFKVSDDGIGINRKVLQNMNVNKSNRNLFRGIGLKNIDERIKLLFGDNYGLTIKSEIKTGTEVFITQPLITLGK